MIPFELVASSRHCAAPCSHLGGAFRVRTGRTAIFAICARHLPRTRVGKLLRFPFFAHFGWSERYRNGSQKLPTARR